MNWQKYFLGYVSGFECKGLLLIAFTYPLDSSPCTLFCISSILD